MGIVEKNWLFHLPVATISRKYFPKEQQALQVPDSVLWKGFSHRRAAPKWNELQFLQSSSPQQACSHILSKYSYE